MSACPRCALTFRGLARDAGATFLRATFEVTLEDDRFFASVGLTASGAVVDIQRDEPHHAGTTGSLAVDETLRRAAREELARARAAAAVMAFDRARKRGSTI